MGPHIVYLSEVPSASDVKLFDGQPDVLGVGQVADLLGVAKATVRREIARGRMKCIHVGTRVKVTKGQLLEYIAGA